MEEIQIFSNPSFGQIRTTTIDGNPYFASVDLAKQLGYKNHRDAISKHVDRADVAKRDTLTRGRPKMGLPRLTRCY